MNNLRFALAACIALLASGCANLDAVNKSAEDLALASGTWNTVTDDLKGSCARRNLMVSTEADLSDCAREAVASASLASTNQVLTAYFTALQQASVKSNFSLNAGLSAAATAADGLPGAKATQVDAVKGLAGYLSGLATRGLEERTVKRLIVDGAPLASNVLDVLNDVVVPELSNRYRDERRQTRLAFASYIQQSGAPMTVADEDCAALPARKFATGTAYLLGQAYCARAASLEARTQALSNYKSSLQRVRQTLAGLQQGSDDLSAKALAQQLGSSATELRKDIAAIKKAF